MASQGANLSTMRRTTGTRQHAHPSEETRASEKKLDVPQSRFCRHIHDEPVTVLFSSIAQRRILRRGEDPDPKRQRRTTWHRETLASILPPPGRRACYYVQARYWRTAGAASRWDNSNKITPLCRAMTPVAMIKSLSMILRTSRYNGGLTTKGAAQQLTTDQSKFGCLGGRYQTYAKQNHMIESYVSEQL